jgi:uncharacterized membrane protein
MQGGNGPANINIKGRMQQILILVAIIAVGIMISQTV